MFPQTETLLLWSCTWIFHENLDTLPLNLDLLFVLPLSSAGRNGMLRAMASQLEWHWAAALALIRLSTGLVGKYLMPPMQWLGMWSSPVWGSMAGAFSLSFGFTGIYLGGGNMSLIVGAFAVRVFLSLASHDLDLIQCFSPSGTKLLSESLPMFSLSPHSTPMHILVILYSVL